MQAGKFPSLVTLTTSTSGLFKLNCCTVSTINIVLCNKTASRLSKFNLGFQTLDLSFCFKRCFQNYIENTIWFELCSNVFPGSKVVFGWGLNIESRGEKSPLSLCNLESGGAEGNEEGGRDDCGDEIVSDHKPPPDLRWGDLLKAKLNSQDSWSEGSFDWLLAPWGALCIFNFSHHRHSF